MCENCFPFSHIYYKIVIHQQKHRNTFPNQVCFIAQKFWTFPKFVLVVKLKKIRHYTLVVVYANTSKYCEYHCLLLQNYFSRVAVYNEKYIKGKL